MQTVSVFDIATKTWLNQSTTAQGEEAFYDKDSVGNYPPDRANFCSVVASAEDNSSHNIYIYGGRDWGSFILTDVYILTLPAFHWIPVSPPNTTGYGRARVGHRCQIVYEKHMVAFRGSGEVPGVLSTSQFEDFCDYNNTEIFQGMAIYDMSSLEWTTKVELENQKYFVPRKLYEIIGGK